MDRSPTPTAASVGAREGSYYARQVQALADELFPGNGGAELRVIVGGREAVIPGLMPGAAELSEMETDVLDALEEAGPGAKRTGQELAKLAGYEYDSKFRRCLSTLHKAGRIRNHSPGYSLPE